MKNLISLCLIISPLLSAEADATKTQSVGGLISSMGVTFASKEGMVEALERGQYDDRNPFVKNVGYILYSSEKNGFDRATVTRVAPEIYLMCNHTFMAFQEAYAKIGKRMEFKVEMGKTVLSSIHKMYAMPFSDDPHCDAILVKMIFGKGTIEPSNNDFLPFFKEEIKGACTAFSVSAAEIFYADSPQPTIAEGAQIQRALSVHTVQSNGVYFVSSIPGILPKEHAIDMIKAISGLQLQMFKGILDPEHQNAPSEAQDVKSIARKGQFFTPENHRLSATLSYGASGSPLIVKKNGTVFIAGILVMGASRPNLPHGADLDEDKMIPLTHEQRFLNLIPYAEEIERRLHELQHNPEYK